MNERNLSRRLSTSVVDALKAHGHILVVKGGASALARELDDLMTPEVAMIAPRLRPYAPLVGEPTSTFGDEMVDQAVEDMVVKLTHALMNSDHVEDVFAEDAVIRRDIFRVVRDGLRERPEAGDAAGDEAAAVTVKLDALGYVAATASRLADPATLRQALDRAAAEAGAVFAGFSAELREATFRLEGDGEDEGLELEEAIADQLTDLVEQGVVELPTIERRVELPRAVTPTEARGLRSRIDAAAQATLRRSGCATSWDLLDARTVRVLFTPFAEHDADGLEAPTAAFARELAALVGAPASSRRDAPKSQRTPSKAPPAAAPDIEDEAPATSKRTKATRKASAPLSEAPRAERPAVAKTAAKKAAAKKTKPAPKATKTPTAKAAPKAAKTAKVRAKKA